MTSKNVYTSPGHVKKTPYSFNVPAEAAEHAFKESLRGQHVPVVTSWAEEMRDRAVYQIEGGN